MLKHSPGPQETRTAGKAIALDPLITSALSDSPIIVYSLSAGKESSAAALATDRYLDSIGHPKSDRFAIHADLGLIEWPSTPSLVAEIARRLDTPLSVVQNATQGLLPRWRQRFANGKTRYQNLESYFLIGPWSSASLRFCTSDTKVGPIGSNLAKSHRGRTIISVVGIRRDESIARSTAPVARVDTRFAGPNNRYGTRMLTWHPIIDWPTNDIYDYHAENDFPLHDAYTRHGLSRLSCSLCVLASLGDLTKSIASGENTAALHEAVALEISSNFSFQPTRWLADYAQGHIPPSLLRPLERAKAQAAERRALEAAMPGSLRFTRGWPPRIPDHAEAQIIAETRAVVLSHHGLENKFPSPALVIDRFAQLHKAREPQASNKAPQ